MGLMVTRALDCGADPLVSFSALRITFDVESTQGEEAMSCSKSSRRASRGVSS
jgi:hypothetical protein